MIDPGFPSQRRADLPAPLFKRPVSELNTEVAGKLARFRSTFVAYPRHIEFHERCDYLQQLGVKTRGQPQMGFRVLAPSGSGKTSAALAYIELVERRRPRSETFIPIIKVDLERAATPKKLMISILDQFGDRHATHGNELVLKRRVFACFERLGTELLMVDEVQHLNYRNGLKNDVTDALKGFLDAGVVPMVFLGTEEAEPMFRRNLQLNGRLLAPCDFHPLKATDAGDRELFSAFVGRLEAVLLQQGIFKEPSRLDERGMLAPLFAVSGGVIGRVSRLFQASLEVAIRRGATRLEPYDLAVGVDRWAIPQGFIGHNPVRDYLMAAANPGLEEDRRHG